MAATTARAAGRGRWWPAGWLLLAVALAGSLWALALRQGPPGADTPPDAAAGPGLWAHPGNAAAAPASAAPLRTGLEDLPRSLAGTEVDGGAEADAAGHLKPDAALRRLFDYFLSTVGEEPLTRVRERLQAWLRSRLPPSAAQEAMGLLDRYLAYQDARGRLGQQQGTSAPPTLTAALLQQRQDALLALRRRHFSPAEVAAFFGDEEAEDRYTLQRLAVLQDTSLPPADKARRLAELRAALPAAVRAAMTVEDQVRDLDALTRDWRERGGTPEALREARVQLVGIDAADRLEALDQKRAAWSQRLQAWRLQRAALVADRSLSTPQREQALAKLRGESFTQQELLRVDAGEPGGR